MVTRLRSLFLSLVGVSFVACGTAVAQIRWERSLDEALKRAKAEKRVVFVAINMDGERANDEMLREHYKDPGLVTLSKRTINVFCSKFDHGRRTCPRVTGISCVSHKRCEQQVRKRILKAPPDKWIVAPQHIFLSPDGGILSSVQYQVTKGELEWVWVDAIRKVDGGFQWQLADRARAPKRLQYPGNPDAGKQKRGRRRKQEEITEVPSQEDVEAILAEIRKGRRNIWRSARKHVPTLLRSDHPGVLELAQRLMAVGGEAQRLNLLRGIGPSSPKSWWRVAAKWVDDKREDVRRAAVDALGRLDEPKSFSVLSRRFRKETDPRIRGHLLRAQAVIKPTDRAVVRQIQKLLKSEKNDELRAHAVVAAAKLEDRKAVTDAIAKALADRSPLVRSTAAYAIAVRRDRELEPHLKIVLEKEAELGTKVFMDAALKALAGGNLAKFDGFLQRIESAGGVVGGPQKKRKKRGRKKK